MSKLEWKAFVDQFLYIINCKMSQFWRVPRGAIYTWKAISDKRSNDEFLPSILFVHNIAESWQEFWICIHCHWTTDETTCPLCRNECRKRKGVQLIQDVLRWPSARKVTKYNVPRHLENLVRKCPQWEETIAALVESNDNYKHFSYKEMEQDISGREILRCTW